MLKIHKSKRKLLLNCLFATSILFTIYLYFSYRVSQKAINNTNIIKWVESDNISCHYINEGDALPSAEGVDFSPPPDSIFFHETSCRGGLNSRQACAVESAARAHPRRQVYVLFSSSVSYNILTRSCLFELKRIPNIEFARVHINEYAKGTFLEHLLMNQTHRMSKWKVVHTSDMLRFITLFKWGGLYLDTDVIVAKNMDELGKNWLARERNSQVNNAIVNVAKDSLGQEFIQMVLEEVSQTYNPDLWLHNGPGALNRVLSKFCNTTKVNEFSSAICHGFQIYDPDLIYPVQWPNYKQFFEPGPLKNDKAFTYHLWNKLSHEVEMKFDSPFDRLAKRYCPGIRSLYGDSFGF